MGHPAPTANEFRVNLIMQQPNGGPESDTDRSRRKTEAKTKKPSDLMPQIAK